MFLRDIVGLGFYLPIYETTKYYLGQHGHGETLSEVSSKRPSIFFPVSVQQLY